jgi:hypothetical protein
VLFRSATIKDQNGIVLPDAKAVWSIDAPSTGITISPAVGKLIIDPSAKTGNITLTATSIANGAVTATKQLILYADPEPVVAPAVTSIEITGSTYIEIPRKNVTYSDYTAVVKDQNGAIMNGEAVTWLLDTSLKGVTLNSENGKIIVETNAKPVSATLTAVSKSDGKVKATKNLIFIR